MAEHVVHRGKIEVNLAASSGWNSWIVNSITTKQRRDCRRTGYPILVVACHLDIKLIAEEGEPYAVQYASPNTPI
jgi:hypothetical protein